MKKKNNQDDDLFVNSGTTSQSSFNRKSRWDVPSRVLKLDPHQLELAVTDPEKFSTFEFEEEGGKGKKRKEKKKLKSTLFDEERIYLHVSLVETKWPSHWYLTLLRFHFFVYFPFKEDFYSKYQQLGTRGFKHR